MILSQLTKWRFRLIMTFIVIVHGEKRPTAESIRILLIKLAYFIHIPQKKEDTSLHIVKTRHVAIHDVLMDSLLVISQRIWCDDLIPEDLNYLLLEKQQILQRWLIVSCPAVVANGSGQVFWLEYYIEGKVLGMLVGPFFDVLETLMITHAVRQLIPHLDVIEKNRFVAKVKIKFHCSPP